MTLKACSLPPTHPDILQAIVVTRIKWPSKMLTHCHPDWYCFFSVMTFLWSRCSHLYKIELLPAGNLVDIILQWFNNIFSTSSKSKRRNSNMWLLIRHTEKVGVPIGHWSSFSASSSKVQIHAACSINELLISVTRQWSCPYIFFILCILFQSGPSQHGWPSPFWVSPGGQLPGGSKDILLLENDYKCQGKWREEREK